jgi:zinc transporter 1
VPHNELGHRHNVKPQKKQRWKKVFSHDHGHAHGDHHDHEHGHTNHGNHHDLGTKAVLIHVLGDAFNNLGVIVAAAVIWKAHYPARFYADPATSMGIGIMLILTALKLGQSNPIPD